jgi:phage/conjugal plasmid C-4 type zinc finger TraR family protein
MDDIDLGNMHAEMHINMAIREARSRSVAGPSAEFCEMCDEPIPEARRKAVPGCRFCVDCQRRVETKWE